MTLILLVEDDPLTRFAIAELLRESDYDVETAGDGAEALDKIRVRVPDAVVLDLVMPGVDGWAFLLACRQDPHFVGLPVVVTSGAREAQADATRLGARGCLCKPFDPDALLTMVSGLHWASLQADGLPENR